MRSRERLRVAEAALALAGRQLAGAQVVLAAALVLVRVASQVTVVGGQRACGCGAVANKNMVGIIIGNQKHTHTHTNRAERLHNLQVVDTCRTNLARFVGFVCVCSFYL